MRADCGANVICKNCKEFRIMLFTTEYFLFICTDTSSYNLGPHFDNAQNKKNTKVFLVLVKSIPYRLFTATAFVLIFFLTTRNYLRNKAQ